MRVGAACGCDAVTNAFTIPKKSAFLEADRKAFTRKPKGHARNMQPIVLPGSSKYPQPKMMEKKK